MALIAEPCFRITDGSINADHVEIYVRELSNESLTQRYVQIDQDGTVIEISQDMARDLRTALSQILKD